MGGCLLDECMPDLSVMPRSQEVRFCTTDDGVKLAYAVTGSGPPFVKAANWLSHLEYDVESPVWRHYVESFSSRFTYVRYDERGTGLSDADITGLTFDHLVSDLESVVDAAELESFPLFGISQGGPVAIEYSVRHPERVTRLILMGAYARGRLRRDDPDLESDYELHQGLVKAGWGTDDPTFRHVFTSQFIPDGSARQHAWFDELMRRSTSKETALEIFRVLANIEVTQRASKVTVPTLVLHSHGDRRVPFTEGRLIASLIPGARLVQLDSNNHLPLESEPAWDVVLSEITSFVAGEPVRADVIHEGYAALLMTDIVDSTKVLNAIGDEAWAHVIRWHDRTLEDLVTTGSGKVVANTGDGVLAMFDDAPLAVACAIEIQKALDSHRRTAGFAPNVRMGVNAGEIKRDREGIAGLEVHKTARIAAAAEAGEILVSRAVADDGIAVFEYGPVQVVPAKGIEEDVEVRAVNWR